MSLCLAISGNIILEAPSFDINANDVAAILSGGTRIQMPSRVVHRIGNAKIMTISTRGYPSTFVARLRMFFVADITVKGSAG